MTGTDIESLSVLLANNSIRELLTVCADHLEGQLENATEQNDKWLRQRLAVDHRGLCQLRDKVTS